MSNSYPISNNISIWVYRRDVLFRDNSGIQQINQIVMHESEKRKYVLNNAPVCGRRVCFQCTRTSDVLIKIKLIKLSAR